MAIIEKLLCYFGICLSCGPKSNLIEVWGECVHCHTKYGVVTRKAIRAYIERREVKNAR